jgi:hypothetical protein
MDDLVILAKTQKEWLAARKMMLNLFFKLGLNVNWEKSDLIPSQWKEWLGMELDTMKERVQFHILSKKLHSIQHECAHLIRKTEAFPVLTYHVARVTGFCVSVTCTIVLRRMLLRNVHRSLTQKKSWEDMVTLSEAALDDLWW